MPAHEMHGGGAVAAGVPFFGPKQYVRTAGPPNVFTATIDVPAWVGPYTLYVQNGDPNGGRRLSSATIEINGKTIASQSDFNQNVSGFERTVTLTSPSTLRVRLTSNPNGYLTLTIAGTNGDHAGPRGAISSPAPDAAINNASPQLAVTYDDPVAGGDAGASGVDLSTLKVALDGVDRTALFNKGPARAIADLNGIVELTDGLHTLAMTIKDVAGHQSSATAQFRVDRSPPTLRILTPTTGAYVNAGTVTVSGTVADEGAGVSVTVNGTAATLSNGAFSAALPAAEGRVDLHVVARDSAGNESTADAWVVVDTHAPELNVTAPADGFITNTTMVHVTGAVTDASPAGVVVNGVSVPVTNGSFSADAQVAGEGNQTIEIIAEDRAGNRSTASRSVVVDLSAPSIQISQPADEAFVATAAPPVRIDWSDAVGVVPESLHVLVDGQDVTSKFTVSATGASGTLQALSDARHQIAATIRDRGANVGMAAATFTVDTVAPEITITQPSAHQFTNAVSIEVSGRVTDAFAVAVTVDGVATALTDGLFTVPSLPVGDGPTQPIAVVAVDAAGNRREAIVTLHVDRAPPTVQIDTPSASAFLKGPLAQVTGSVSDASPIVGVDVNGVAATLTGLSFSAQIPVADGAFPIRATARDAANNVSVAERSITVDSAPPAISVSSPAEGFPTNEAAVTVTGSVADASPTTLRIDASGASVPVTLSNGSFSQSVPLGSEGPNTIALVATDAAGNQSTFDLHVTRDLTPPTIEIVSPSPMSVIGAEPVSVTGLVYDLTATTVRVNGAEASRVQDSWTGVVSFGAEGTQTISVVAVDAAGNQSTATRSIVLDTSAPIVTIDQPRQGALTAVNTVTVSGRVADVSLASVVVAGRPAAIASGAATTPFSVEVELVDGDNHLHVVATDRLGRTSEAEVVLTRDSIAPSIQMTAPETISRRRGAQATVTASDNLAIAQVTVTANGVALGTFTTTSFTVDLTPPDTLAVGASLVVSATAVDRAGNSTTATHALRVISDGVLVGQALDDPTGLPLEGATVTIGAGGSGGSGGSTTTDARGGYSLPAVDANVRLSVSKAGMTSVERLVPVQSGVGTAVVDARLTKLAAPKTVAPGDTITANPESQVPSPVSITLPGGAAAVRLTTLSPQGLPALLPLGWSPLAAFDLRSPSPIAELTATVALAAVVPAGADDQNPPPSSVHLVQYRPSLHAWTMVQPNVAVSNGRVTLNLVNLPATAEPQVDADPSVATAFALVVGDIMDPPIPVAAVNEPLTGVDVVLLPSTATSAGAVTPSVIPPAGGTAMGVIGIQSPAPLPSGTIVQAQVTETFTLVSGDIASEETRSQDIVLYRAPMAAPSVVQGFTPALSAYLPITPTRAFAAAELAEGHVHLDILAGREAVRGQTGGSEPLTLTSGDVKFIVPAHALPDDTAIRVQPTVLSTFLPSAADLQALAEVVVDLSGRALGLAAELSVPMPAGSANPGDRFLLGRVDRIDGVPRVAIVGLAAVTGDRLVSRSASGLPGVTIGGRYILYRTSSPFGLIGATTSAAGTPVSAIASTDRWPFIARGDAAGRSTLVAPEGAVQVSARVFGTALAGSTTATLVADQFTPVTIALGGTATTATVMPADGAVAVSATAQIEIVTSAAIAPASLDTAVVRLLKGDATVAVRLVLAGSGRTLAVVPQARLESGIRYRLDAAGLVDIFGAAISVPQTAFTIATDAALEFNPDKLVVSFPDEDGIVDVTAPAGSLQPGTSVLVVNAGSGEVVSFTAGNDGSLHGQLSATIDHRLIVTITDPQGKATSFQRSKYVAPDGTTAIGAGGGTVEGEGGIELWVPEGAVDAGVVLKIEPFGPDFMEERPTMPGARFGGGMKIGSTKETHFKKEVDLAFRVPADAPANPKDAFYYIYRRIEGPNGQVYFETIDQAFVEGEGANARVVTASYPFTGYKDGWNRWDVTRGSDLGLVGFGSIANMGTCNAMLMWTINALLPGAPVGGVITGRVLRPTFEKGSAAPVYKGVRQVKVSRDDVRDPSETIAITDDDGRFTFFDPHFSTGRAQLRAETSQGVFTATTYAVAELDTKIITDDALSALLRGGMWKNISTANITLPPLEPLPPAPQIAIRVFTEANDVRKEVKGLIIAGTPLVVGFSAQDGTVSGATINGQEQGVHADPKRGQVSAHGMDAILDQVFTPAQPGSYTITATAVPAFGTPVSASLSLRVIAAGGGTQTSVPGRPGVLNVTPEAGAKAVAVSVFPQIAFTEPVVGVTPERVRLEEMSGNIIPVRLSGVTIVNGQPEAVDDVGAGHVVTSLTLVPSVGLRYGTTYRIVLTEAIVDRDTDAAGAPAPQPLVAFNSTFTTFGPEALDGTEETPRASGLVVLGDRAYLTETLYGGGTGGLNQAGNLRVYDLSAPIRPQELRPETYINYPPRDIAGEETGEGADRKRTVAVATAPRTWFFLEGELIYFYEIQSTPSNLFLYDVTSEPPKWVGAVNLTDNLMDGTPNRIVMKDGMVYAATLNKGIQVVDLQAARNGFPDTGVTENDYLMYKKVFDGEMNKDAIVMTIPITDPPNAPADGQFVHLPLTDLKVDDFIVEGTSRRLVIATGPRKQIGLVIVDPLMGRTLWRGPVAGPSGSIDWANSVAVAHIDGRPLAIVGGWGTFGSKSTNVLAVLDLTPLATREGAPPDVLGMIELSHSIGDILIKGTTAIVSGGTDGTATILDLMKPARPKIAGSLAGVGSRLALSDQLLFSTERSFIKGVPTALGGVQTTALAPAVLLGRSQPTLAHNLHEFVPPRMETLTSTPIQVRVVPKDAVVESAVLQVTENGQVRQTHQVQFAAGAATVTIPARSRFLRESALRAEMSVTTDRGTFASQTPLSIGTVVLTLDADNNTIVNDADDTARRQGKVFAFWQADPANLPQPDPKQPDVFVAPPNAVTDLATVRFRATTFAPAGKLRLVVAGPREAKSTLVQKAKDGKLYLMDPTQNAQQLRMLTWKCNPDFPTSFGTCSSQGDTGVIKLPMMTAGVREFLWRCDECPTDDSRKMRIEYETDPGVFATVDEVDIDVRGLNRWMTLFSAYKTPEGAVVEDMTEPLAPWAAVSDTAETVNVLAHGFNVPYKEAVDFTYVSWFKRLYWAGQPVFAPQNAHTVGIVWPGANKAVTVERTLRAATRTIDALARMFYVPPIAEVLGQKYFDTINQAVLFPEDEFRAFQTGVPLGLLLDRLKAGHPTRRLNLLAHSLGNIAMNSAIKRATLMTPSDRYVMLEAAVAEEAFDVNYQLVPGSLEDRLLVQTAFGAADDGFPNDEPRFSNPEDEWGLFHVENVEWLKQFTGISDNKELNDFYLKRWRRVEDGKASPWRGIFADNLNTVTMFNAYNTQDRAITLEAITPWWLCQVFQKPYPPIDLNFEEDFNWVQLPYFNKTEMALAGRNETRRWAELAFWFQPVSRAAGSTPLRVLIDPATGADRNRRMDDIAGTGGPTQFLSHTYMLGKPIHEIWRGLDRIKAMFERP